MLQFIYKQVFRKVIWWFLLLVGLINRTDLYTSGAVFDLKKSEKFTFMCSMIACNIVTRHCY